MIRTTLIYLALTIVVFEVHSEDAYPCKARTTENGIICVCNSDYCDNVPELSSFTNEGEYQWYTTSQDSPGFQSIVGNFTNSQDAADTEIVIDTGVLAANGTILGFGGAFTDSSGVNIYSLPDAAQDNLMNSYFGDDGIEYSFGRVPMGGADFSSRYYSYHDNEDPTLANFSLQYEDFNYKIPLIKKAKTLRGEKEFKLYASVWSAPPWMKTNNDWVIGGFLKDEYYQTWANYFLRFLEAYAEQDVTFWGVTTQNEPSNGLTEFVIEGFVGTTWLPGQVSNWTGTNLGPTIRSSNFSDVKILVHDDQRNLLPQLNSIILGNETTLEYIDGVGVHYYTDSETSEDWLDYARSDKTDFFILATEACAGFKHAYGLEDAVSLGNWTRAEIYLQSIFQDLRKGVAGWVDWNIALNTTGGPLFLNNPVDSPIIVNASAGEFYKQPTFYALGHFSKFVIPGSVLVHTEASNDNVQVLAFLRPDDLVTLVIWNQNEDDATVSIKNLSNSIRTLLTLKAKSLNTFLYSAQ